MLCNLKIGVNFSPPQSNKWIKEISTPSHQAYGNIDFLNIIHCFYKVQKLTYQPITARTKKIEYL
jgi:hypothetical protein